MSDSSFIYAVTTVVLFAIVAMVIATPALSKRNHDLKAKLDARGNRLSLHDFNWPQDCRKLE
jgi:hypothetical protein